MRPLILALSLVLVASGCTFRSVKPTLGDATGPASQPRATSLVVGEIKTGDPLWETYRLHVTRGITDWYGRNAQDLKVLTAKPPDASPGTVVLIGTITNVDKGNTALRWIVGMGAGQAKVNGDFEIQSLEGVPLVKFSARESYLGGAGIGGAGFLDMEDLVKRFAETVAETTLKWSRGQSID
ncbi:MAG TPA: DUF4410 domain-containing protein [Methylomirabilota bacterium]|jgi:hypothetical protein